MEDYQHFIAGWGGGIFGIFIGHPMDTVKTYQQMSNRKLSTRDAVNRIIKKDGVRGFYKGMMFPLLSSGSLNSLFFGVCNASLNLLQNQRGYKKVIPSDDHWLEDLFIAGCIAGAAQALITCPSELIKIQIQLGKGIVMYRKTPNYTVSKVSTYLTLQDLLRRYGVQVLYIGFLPTMYRDAFGGGIYITSYQFTRHYMYGKLNLNPGLLETLVAGGVAGLASWIPVVPFDTIKSRIQGDNFKNPMYKGMIDCSVDLYKHSGYHGFFKGCFMIIVRSIPVNVAIIYGYELILFACKKIIS